MCCILGNYTIEECFYLGLVRCDFPIRFILYPVYSIPAGVLAFSYIVVCGVVSDVFCGVNAEKVAETITCIRPYRSFDMCCCCNTPRDEYGPVNLLLWERKISQANKELLSKTT